MRQTSWETHFRLLVAALAVLAASDSIVRSCAAAAAVDGSSSAAVEEESVAGERQQQQQQQQSRYVNPKQDDVMMGCQELTSKRYISDGFCTSVKPITERVCGGLCLPVSMPWYAEYVKVWARTKVAEWRCVDDQTRRRAVTLMCENGETRSYTIRVVTGCKCKQFSRLHNQSPAFVASKRRPEHVGVAAADDATTDSSPVEELLSRRRPDAPRERGASRHHRRRPPAASMSPERKLSYAPDDDDDDDSSPPA